MVKIISSNPVRVNASLDGNYSSFYLASFSRLGKYLEIKTATHFKSTPRLPQSCLPPSVDAHGKTQWRVVGKKVINLVPSILGNLLSTAVLDPQSPHHFA
jgi:hypothetical protein